MADAAFARPVKTLGAMGLPDRDVAYWTTLAPRSQHPLGQILLEDGSVDPAHLLKAAVMRQRQNMSLGQILLAQEWVTPAALAHALSRQWHTGSIDPAALPPDPRLIDALGAEFCLTHAVLPWRRIAGVTWVATARPERFADIMPHLPGSFGQVRMLLCHEDQAQVAILSARKTSLIRQAEMRVPPAESCRTCQSACKRDPLSARKRDPLAGLGSGDLTRQLAQRAA